MHLKLFLSVGFAIHATLGSFCMMPMAFAQEMPHEEHIEMSMTPVDMISMLPMSSAHCEHCVHITKEDPAPMGAGCAGHCLSKSNDVGVAMVQNAPQTFLPVTLPPSFINPVYAEQENSFVEANAPPTAIGPTRTVVLLE